MDSPCPLHGRLHERCCTVAQGLALLHQEQQDSKKALAQGPNDGPETASPMGDLSV